MRKIFLGFIVYALAELALLIVIGQNIGVLSTLLLIMATSIIGIYVMKNKGMNSVQNVKNTLARGEAPGAALVDTFLTFGGGLLLALPDFNRCPRFIPTHAIFSKNVPTHCLLLDA